MVQIDMAGPRLPRTYDFIPDDIHHLANVVLDSCVTGSFEIGGFATSDLQVMSGWITAEETRLDRPFRTSHPTLLPSFYFALKKDSADIPNFSSDIHRLPHCNSHQCSPRMAVPRELRSYHGLPLRASRTRSN